MHGIWSWINDANRQHILKFIARFLKPGGATYVSYNAKPGYSPIAPLRELMMLGYRAKIRHGVGESRGGTGLWPAHPAAGCGLFPRQPADGQVSRPHHAAGARLSHPRVFQRRLVVVLRRRRCRALRRDRAFPRRLRASHGHARRAELHARHASRDRRTGRPDPTRNTERPHSQSVVPTRHVHARCGAPAGCQRRAGGTAFRRRGSAGECASRRRHGDLRRGPPASRHRHGSRDGFGGRAGFGRRDDDAPGVRAILDRKCTAVPADHGGIGRGGTGIADGHAAGAERARRQAQPPAVGACLARRRRLGDRFTGDRWRSRLVERPNSLFLLARLRGDDPVALVAGVMPDQRHEAIAQAYGTFDAARIPLLRNLGIV